MGVVLRGHRGRWVACVLGLVAGGCLWAGPGWTAARATAGGSRSVQGEAGVLSSDFNGDGREDLAVGVPLEDGAEYPDQGEVDVFYGSGGGLRATQPLFIRSTPGIDQSFYRFGSAVATGDVNGDGYADLAVGVPGYPLDGFGEVGTVILIPGSPEGLNPDAAVFLNAKDAGHDLDNGEQFGAALTMGDFNGDHLADLAVGAPTASIGQTQHAGGVAVFYGQRDLASIAHGSTFLFQFGASTNEDFGAALAAGDFYGDGRDDLAVGVPLRDVRINSRNYPGAGDVYVYQGSSQGLSVRRAERIFQEARGAGRTEVGAHFGAALAGADFNGDGRDDLAIGVPFYSETHHTAAAGAVVVLDGGRFQLGRGPDEAVLLQQGFNGVPGHRQIEAHFGESLVAANFGRGHLADLAIGIPGKNVDGKRGAGEVAIMYSTDQGHFRREDNTLLSQGQEEVVGRPDRQDGFGATLAGADFNGDGRTDLAVGVPGEDVVNQDGQKEGNAGAVNVFQCTFDGCRRSDHMLTQKWLHLAPEPGDQFGLALGARGGGD